MNDEFAGGAGGCGYIPEDGEIDMFMISKTTGIAEEIRMDRSDDIPVVTPQEAESSTQFIQAEIEQLLKEFENRS